MPPSAAPEWLLTGWIFERSATSAPASNASIAARIPAQPAPTTSTSCFPSTARNLSDTAVGTAQHRGPEILEIPDSRYPARHDAAGRSAGDLLRATAESAACA